MSLNMSVLQFMKRQKKLPPKGEAVTDEGDYRNLLFQMKR